MHWTVIIAERRATEARARGDLNNLEGEGAPLDLSEDLLVPAEIRTLMRVLKNAGYTPPEIALLKSIANAEKELVALPAGERTEKAKALITKITMLREAQYAAKLA